MSPRLFVGSTSVCVCVVCVRMQHNRLAPRLCFHISYHHLVWNASQNLYALPMCWHLFNACVFIGCGSLQAYFCRPGPCGQVWNALQSLYALLMCWHLLNACVFIGCGSLHAYFCRPGPCGQVWNALQSLYALLMCWHLLNACVFIGCGSLHAYFCRPGPCGQGPGPALF